ncbi:MAG: hypothetical protein DRH26_01070 [Deltaproteobacteria bacterium]|nr:MAG: hypothetical protein DRH26_01070 [Deltaproteobacteria bacterium]
MADEPVGTSPNYNPWEIYTPPVGRLPVLGKIRAEIDKLRASIADDLNTVLNRNAAQADNTLKVAGEIAALATQTEDGTRKVTGDLAALATRVENETSKNTAEISSINTATINDTTKTTNDTTKTVNDTARTLNDTNKTDGELAALATQTIDNTTKVTGELAALVTQTDNDTTKTVNDTTKTTNDTNKTNADISAQVDKTAAEVGLLEQKTESELAQVSDTVATGSVVGVIGKQKDLFQKQTDGFDRDAEQKLAKIMVDTWSVRQTTDGADPVAAGLAEADIQEVVVKAKAGIEVV